MDAIVAKKWKASHQAAIQSLETALESMEKPHALKLLQKMTAKAEESELYRDRLITWLDGEATYAHILKLCAPFPSINDLTVRNNVFLLNRIKMSSVQC